MLWMWVVGWLDSVWIWIGYGLDMGEVWIMGLIEKVVGKSREIIKKLP